MEKDPADRNDEDIEVLKEFTHTLEAFAGITSVRLILIVAALLMDKIVIVCIAFCY